MDREKLKRELSGRRAQELIFDIAVHNRAKGSEGFSRALEVVQKALNNRVENERITFDSDGTYNGWEVPEEFNMPKEAGEPAEDFLAALKEKELISI